MLSVLNGDVQHCHTVDWSAVYSMLVQQGVAAVAWDNVQRAMTEGGILPEQQLSKTQKIQWALAVEQVER